MTWDGTFNDMMSGSWRGKGVSSAGSKFAGLFHRKLLKNWTWEEINVLKIVSRVRGSCQFVCSTSTLSPGDPVSGRDQVRTAGYGEVDSGSGRHSSPGPLWEKNHLNLSLTSSSAANLVWLQLWLATSSFDDSTYARAGRLLFNHWFSGAERWVR